MTEHHLLARVISRKINEFMPKYPPSVSAAMHARQYVIDEVAKEYNIPKEWITPIIAIMPDMTYFADWYIEPNIKDEDYDKFLEDCDQADS